MRKMFCVVLLLIGTLSVPAFAQIPRYALFPEIANGAGWSNEFFFTNQGISKITGITIDFYDTNGSPLSVASNLSVGTHYVFDLNPGATQVIRMIPPDSLVEGSALITYPSSEDPVRATEVYRYEQGGIVQVEVGVPQQEYGSNFSFPIEISPSEGIDTAVVILNPPVAETAQTMIVNLIRPDGSIEATRTMPMQPGQQFAGYFYESELFPGLTNFIGSVSISSPFGVGVLALRQDKEAFGAIATDGGPVLGPFLLTGNAVPEQEPNDTPSSAQAISGSTIISGTIESIGDLDSFVFMGKAGDIISVICDAQGSGSYLDSVVEIYDDSVQKIGENDQNGLSPLGYPINDSFVQMALPADGIYYIVVTDYFGNGGPNYTYNLHVKLP